jgi:hypothetical protein
MSSHCKTGEIRKRVVGDDVGARDEDNGPARLIPLYRSASAESEDASTSLVRICPQIAEK